MEFLSAFLMGFAESYRGAKAGLPRFLEKAILAALALLCLVGFPAFLAMMGNWMFAVAFLGLFSIGCSVSWGAVISGSLKKDTEENFTRHVKAKQDKGDWYLHWYLRVFDSISPMTGLFLRSVIWGACASAALFAFGYVAAGLAMLVVYSVAMPLAVKFLHAIEDSKFDKAIGKMCLKLVDKDRAWARHEVYRGWIAGLLLLGLALVI